MQIKLHTRVNELQRLSGEEARKLTGSGLTWIERHATYGDPPRAFTYHEHTWPEFGPSQLPAGGLQEPMILQLGARRWKVHIDLDYDCSGHPAGGTVTFEETDEPLTELKPASETSCRDRLFGQPCFIQGEVFPHLNGKSACLLAVIESGWGDAGNENLFLALDDDGIPAGLYHEFSCC